MSTSPRATTKAPTPAPDAETTWLTCNGVVERTGLSRTRVLSLAIAGQIRTQSRVGSWTLFVLEDASQFRPFAPQSTDHMQGIGHNGKSGGKNGKVSAITRPPTRKGR